MKALKLQYASNFFLNLHKRHDFDKILTPVCDNLAILGNINNVDNKDNMKLYDSFLQYVSSSWKTVYLVVGPYEYCSRNPKPFYELYSNLTYVKHKYNNIIILNNNNYNPPKTDIHIVGSTLWTKNPYYRLPCSYEFSYMYKASKDGKLRQFLGDDLQEWYYEDITHVNESIKHHDKNIILSHHLPTMYLTNPSIKNRMEATSLENMFSKKIAIWLGGSGNKSTSGVFGLTKDTFCAVNSYTTFDKPEKINNGYDPKAYVSLRTNSIELV